MEPVTGRCYVLTFSSKHNLTLADLSPSEIVPIINTWAKIYTAHLVPDSPLAALAAANAPPPTSEVWQMTVPKEQLRYMQIFENKGSAMGCSNPHPHGQIWTTSCLPEEQTAEFDQLSKYYQKHGSHMLEDYAKLESEKQERVVFENESFLVICPWWATWPFETMILSKKHKRALTDLNSTEREQLAEAMSDLTRKYDNLFETHFPYCMGIHQAPLSGSDLEFEVSHLHFHFNPPLLRSATVKKFLVG